MRARLTWALLASASLSSLAPSAFAQTEPETSEEIVVTAQKREEELRDVPQSVTAITEETLERVGANTLDDYAGLVPGLNVTTGTQQGASRLTLRGLNTGGISPTVATYVDETPFGSSTALANGAQLALDLNPFDIARVEVLRGPQGTLYGANALGGLLKFVTVDPSAGGYEARISGTTEQTEDGDEGWSVRGLVNIPLGDQAGLRLSALRRSQGGFIDDASRGVEDINGVDTTGLRASFLLHATDNLTFRLSATAQDIEADGSNGVDYFPPLLSPPLPPPPRSLQPVAGDLNQTRGFTESIDVSYRIFNATTDWDLGWATLTASGSFNELDQTVLQDTTAILGGLSHLSQEVSTERFTEEVRLTSPSSEHFEWLVGLYFNQEDSLLDQDIQLGAPPGLLSLQTASLVSDYNESAVFGTVTYYITPQLDVSLGARYAENEQDATTRVGVSLASQSSEDDATTYSLAPRWRPTEDFMLYARFATGYRPGGPNVQSTTGAPPPPFMPLPPTYDPDTTTNYEVGVRADFFDNLLRVDVTAFRIDWEDIQLISTDGTVVGTDNAGSARSEGVEWSLGLTPGNLSAQWTGAWVDAQLRENTSLVLLGVEGDRLPYAPEWSTAVDIDYRWDAFGGAQAYVGGTWRYVGEQFSDFSPAHAIVTGDSQVRIPEYDILNLRAGLDFERFSVELFARNVGDERAPTSFGGLFGTLPNNPANRNGQSAVTRPRTIGVSVSARF